MRFLPERPPGVRYWNQKVREPPGRMRTAKPVMAWSQIMVWPVVGAGARRTAVSVSFRVMAGISSRRHTEGTGLR